MTTHPLLLKLERHQALSTKDIDLLSIMLADIRTFENRRDIIKVGENSEFVYLMTEGWSCRYSVENGRRQITALLVPGDFCNTPITMLDEMDYSIRALGKARVALLPKDLMAEVAMRPSLTRAIWWASLVDENILRAWLVNMGCRNAVDRVAHLVCELHARLLRVGIGMDDGFSMPLTQQDLADALGLTPVHTNRILRSLRQRGLMTFSNRTIAIHDLQALRETAGFNPRYLQMNSL